MASRRDFLKTASLFSAGLAFNSREVWAGYRSVQQPKFDKVKIAYIGIGNRGEQDIDEFAKTGMVEVVALCDVDMGNKQTEKVMNMYPNAKRFKDFREMFEPSGRRSRCSRVRRR